VADEVLEEGVDIVASVDVVLLEDLVGELGASLEGQALGLAEGVVAVEQDVLDLMDALSALCCRYCKMLCANYGLPCPCLRLVSCIRFEWWYWMFVWRRR